jgi:hypothetical protein
MAEIAVPLPEATYLQNSAMWILHPLAGLEPLSMSLSWSLQSLNTSLRIWCSYTMKSTFQLFYVLFSSNSISLKSAKYEKWEDPPLEKGDAKFFVDFDQS